MAGKRGDCGYGIWLERCTVRLTTVIRPLPETRPGASGLPDLAGHGLWVVRHIADQMQIASGPRGTRVTVTFNARGPE